MGGLADFRGAVATVLGEVCAAHEGWNVSPLPVDALAPPVFMLEWSEPWLSGRATFCRYTAALDVRCVSSRLDPDPGIELLELMVEAALAAFDRARLPVLVVSSPRPFPVGGVTYQAATVTLSQSVPINGGTTDG